MPEHRSLPRPGTARAWLYRPEPALPDCLDRNNRQTPPGPAGCPESGVRSRVSVHGGCCHQCAPGGGLQGQVGLCMAVVAVSELRGAGCRQQAAGPGSGRPWPWQRPML